MPIALPGYFKDYKLSYEDRCGGYKVWYRKTLVPKFMDGGRERHGAGRGNGGSRSMTYKYEESREQQVCFLLTVSRLVARLLLWPLRILFHFLHFPV